MLKRNIWLMYAISFLQGMIFYGPVATLYRDACGVTIFQITIIESISLALCLIFELPWGIIADKIGYRRTLLLCNGLYFLSKIVFWKADGFLLFLLERVMLSVVISGISGVDSSVLYLSSKEGDSQKVFGTYESLGMAGLLTASFIYTKAVGSDYRLAGFLTVLSYGAAFLLSLFLIEVKGEKEENQGRGAFFESFHHLVRKPKLLLFLLSVALFSESHQLVTVFLSQLKYVEAHMSHEMMGILYSVLTVIGLGGMWSSLISKKFGEKKTAVFCFLISAFGCGLLALTHQPLWIVTGLLLFRGAFTVFGPLQMELQNRMIKTKDRATALSVNALVIDSIAVFLNVSYGKIAEASLLASFAFGSVLTLIGGVCFLLAYRYLFEKKTR